MKAIKDSAGVIYPSELCTWVQTTNPDGSYTIDTVKFYGTGTAVALTGCVLGYIGTSGKFGKLSK